MPFLIEDGTGVVGANSYITIAQFRSHFLDRGRDTSLAQPTVITDAQVQTAAVRASDYIDKRFGRRFRGFRKNKLQGLEWPRNNAYDDDDYVLDGLPKQLTMACAEYAMRAHTLVELAPDPALPFTTRDATGTGTATTAGQVVRNRSKVGPIEEESEFRDMSGSSSSVSKMSGIVEGLLIPAYPAADLWIEELLDSAMSHDVGRG